MNCPDRECVACRELACANPACDRERRIPHARCGACAMYWSRHGAERPAALCRHGRTNPDPACANPVCDMPRAERYTRCHACRLYRHRHGSERPERLTRPVPAFCAIAGCGKPRRCREYCGAHDKRLRRQEARARLTAAS